MGQKNIILNRGPETTLLYNVLARGLDHCYPELVMIYDQINRRLSPDLVVLLDTSVEIALARAAKQATTDQFQQHSIYVHENRRQLYLELASKYGWMIVDSTPPAEDVVDTVWQLVRQRLGEVRRLEVIGDVLFTTNPWMGT